MRLRLGLPLVVTAILAVTHPSLAQQFQVELLKEAPPAGLSEPIRQSLEGQGYRITSNGKTHVDIWLCKGVPAKAKPSGPKGAVLYPILTEGELIGAARYATEGQDFRDQEIVPGLYTLRYGKRLDDGNHANVSPYQDYAVLLPAAVDKQRDAPAVKEMHKTSAEVSGTTHPAILYLAEPLVRSAKASAPEMSHDEMADTWGLVVPLTLTVAGESAEASIVLNLLISGASAG